MVSSAAGLDAAKQQLTVLDAEIAVAKADVTQAEADLDTAELNLGYTDIRSPIDGYVGNRAAQDRLLCRWRRLSRHNHSGA